jgi:hypothetical protein
MNISMRMIASLLLLCTASVALAGELRGAVLTSSKEEPKQQTTATPPTAWEIPQPLAPASTAKKPPKASGEESLLVLIPQTPGKRPKPPQIVLDEKKAKAKPDPAFITLKDTVTFISKVPLTLSFTEDDKVLSVSKKRVTKGFSKEGVYRYTAKEVPALKGLVIVGTGARTQEVSGDFRVKGLEEGQWSAYLVTSKEIIYAGEVSIGEDVANIEITIP